MGFRKRALGPKQVIAADVEEAVDWAASKVDKVTYRKKRNLEDLVFRADEEPTIFTLRAGLPPALIARVESAMSVERFLLAFQFGVESCSDRSLGLEWRYDLDAPMIRLESMEGIPKRAWIEIGRYVLQREELTEGE